MSTSRDSTAHERHPLARPTFLASAIALFALVVAVAWIVLGGGVRGGDAATASRAGSPSMSGAASTASEAGMSAGSQSASSASTCGTFPAGADKDSDAAPTGRVSMIGGVATVVSDAAGPAVLDGIPRCYAPSSQGAVVAAANALSWFAQGPSVARVVRTLGVDDANARRAIAAMPEGQGGTEPQGVRIHGFSTERWSTDLILVVLVIDSPSTGGKWLTWPMKMQYTGGDWKFVWPEGDNWGASGVQPGSLPSGFVEWRLR
ncbi:MAG: hypothetical protein SPH79_04090 [Schaalia hyovaginalis]|uniref:hypothetical protein n=1 Tax=Schaalia hyovaginalis TaxID=29316 RepID=UPI002A91FEC8|nr:hypothetical protein [Schaalia hyovaginalis]MDY6213652.1 hypothetical protein [Schaalia hyovaginalis]